MSKNTNQVNGLSRPIYCSICGNKIGYLLLESVWEENDEKTYRLIHPLCLKCEAQSNG